MTDISDKFAVLVVSCDKYSDLWEPFFELFKKFWPNCPFRVYLLSNKKSFEYSNVTGLLVGEDLSWSDNLCNALKRINEEYVLLFLDDLFLKGAVNTQEVLKVFKWILDSQANYVRMNPSQKPDKPFNELVGIISKGAIYRTSTILSVWKRDVIFDLLKPGETAWDFEVYGTERSDRYNGFYSTWKDFFPVINGVIKSKWHKGAIRKLMLLGVNPDTSKRKVMSYKEMLIFYMKGLRSRVFNFFPSRHKRKLKDLILRGKYNYNSNQAK